MAVVSTIRNRAKEADQVCADAVDVARMALVQQAGVSPDAIGEHLGAEPVADRVVMHLFPMRRDPGCYNGLALGGHRTRAPRSKLVTDADESVLLPGPDALLAPPWVQPGRTEGCCRAMAVGIGGPAAKRVPTTSALSPSPSSTAMTRWLTGSCRTPTRKMT